MALSPNLKTVYPCCSTYLPQGFVCPPEDLPKRLTEHHEFMVDAPFLADLAAIELAAYILSITPPAVPPVILERMIHPGLELIEVEWQGLPDLLNGRNILPSKGEGIVLLIADGENTGIRIATPDNHDLLALKIVAEHIAVEDAAREAQISIGVIDNILYGAEQKGFLLKPASRIIRPAEFRQNPPVQPELLSSPAFTLQWHITQACDLHCRHCYDRSERATVTVRQGTEVLDDLYRFCALHNVYGQVTFTGGNPMISPHFYSLYREAVDRGFVTAVLGNPMDRSFIEKMAAIRPPEFFQVSLEGLRDHNDYMRGKGHFDRVIGFLDLLREMKIFSMVMLTLTRANLAQVLPLAEDLRGKVDLFAFNRLAMVGEGAGLVSVTPEEYPAFLEQFQEAAENNPALSLKDNFFNLLRHRQNLPQIGGCTGFGCGAAFNFLSLLPDGEVHACRKLPSLIGNIYRDSLTDIYHSPLAKRYRMGSSGCRDCAIRTACRGCPAVSFGFGQNIFTDIDPYCFKQ